MLGPVVPPCGPAHAKIALVGEAPGEQESAQGKPFIGPSGYELRRMLRMVGIDMDQCYRTNVFNQRPPNNDIALGYGTITPSVHSKSLGPLTSNPTTFIGNDHLPQLDRLHAELLGLRPNIIVALGNTAAWALGLTGGISSIRGSVYQALQSKTKLLPTYHPSAVLRQWSLRPTVLADLEKAHAESHTPDLQFDNAELWLEPTLDDLVEFGALHMASASICSTDVETKRGQITCLSFAPTSTICLVVPFWQEGLNPNYWPTPEAEHTAWEWVRGYVEDPNLTKVLQNGLYDTQYFHAHGMRPQGCTEDTMLQSHSLYCELQKGLGYLGSIYSNTPSWKHMRTQKVEELNKREE